MEIILGVPAHELEIAGEGHVALEDPGPHARRGDVGLDGVLGEHERRAAMADREPLRLELQIDAGEQPLPERTLRHALDEVIRAWAQLDWRSEGRRRDGGQVADRVMAINDGRLLAIGSPDQVRENPDVQRAYLGVAE